MEIAALLTGFNEANSFHFDSQLSVEDYISP